MIAKVFKIFRIALYSIAGFFMLLTLLLLVFRNKIERYAVQQLDPFIKVPVYIHDVDFTFWKTFPNFSLRLKGVLVKDYDSVKKIQTDTLLYADKIDLKANTWNLIQGDFTIQSIEVSKSRLGLRVFKTGEKNFDIFRSNTDQESKQDFEIDLKKVLFLETDFSFENMETNQEYRAQFDKLKMSGKFKDDAFEMLLNANFNLTKFRDKSITLLRKAEVNIETQVAVNTKSKSYSVTGALAEINGIPFSLNYNQDSTRLNLDLEAKKIPLQDWMSTIHQKDLERLKTMEVSGEADIALKINGSSKINEPVNIAAAFEVRKGKFKDVSNKLNIPKLEIRGSYIKEVGYSENLDLSKFEINTLGQSLKGKLSLSDFQSPRINATANGNLNLEALHHFFPIPGIESIFGTLAINGNLQANIFRPGEKNQEVKIINSKSDLDCKEIRIKPASTLPEFKEINGKVSTRNDDFVFNQFEFKTQNTKVQVSGKMDNLLDYLEQGLPLNLQMAIRADQIDVNEFIKENNSSATVGNQQIGVYTLPRNILGSIEFDINKLTVGNHVFSKLVGITLLKDREMDFRKIRLEHIGSTIAGDFKIHEKSAGTLDLSGDVKTSSVDLKTLFGEWNNFEQAHIQSENISGKADVKLKFFLPFNIQKGPTKEALKAQVTIKIVGGALNKVNAFKEIAASMRSNDFVRVFLGKSLKNIEKKLDNLTFDQLENTFTISNSQFYIPKMTIKTNIMDLVVSGWQNFDESLEYHFEFDIKELRNNNREEPKIGFKTEFFSSRLFLKMYGTLSNLQFSWDNDAKKAFKQEQKTQEKNDVKSMLKSELGLFKKDSTIQRYQKTQAPKETIEIDFGNQTTPEPNVDRKKREINEKFNRLRKENQSKSEKVVIEFD